VDEKSLAHPAHPSTEDHDQGECPHACNDGWVTIGQIVVDPETGRGDGGARSLPLPPLRG
jgi:hypothetical protein